MMIVTADQSTPEFYYEINCDQCGSRQENAVAFETFLGAGRDIFVCFPCLGKAMALNPSITPPPAESPEIRSLETSLHDRKLSVRVNGRLISTIMDVYGLSLVSLRSAERLVDLAIHGEDGKAKCVTLRY